MCISNLNLRLEVRHKYYIIFYRNIYFRLISLKNILLAKGLKIYCSRKAQKNMLIMEGPIHEKYMQNIRLHKKYDKISIECI